METLNEKGRFLAGRYRIITMKAKPRYFPLRIWLALRRQGWLDHMVKSISPEYTNLIMLGANTGLNLVLQALNGQTVFPLAIDSASIGTGNTAPASSDTDLVTPVVEGILKSTSEIQTLNILYTEWFISNDELPDGEYKEFALWCGTQIFARSLIGPPTHTKAANEDTLIVYNIEAFNT